jgi:hypothetical protein
MGIFNHLKDFLVSGITPQLKKEYSPFLSAVLLHLPNFKIIDLNDGTKSAEIESLNGNYKIKINLNRNYSKINELHTQIFQFLESEIIKEIETPNSLKDFLSYHDYKKFRNISKQSYTNISKAVGSEWLVDHYLKLKSKRSYLRYLNQPENKLKIEDYKVTLESQKEHYKNIVSKNLSLRTSISPEYFFDCLFKGVDSIERRRVSEGFSFNEIDRVLKQAEFSECGNYRIMDNWYLKLTVYLNNDIYFEDVQLVNGQGWYNLHEDDFLYFSEAIDSMFGRWDRFK